MKCFSRTNLSNLHLNYTHRKCSPYMQEQILKNTFDIKNGTQPLGPT